MRSLFLLVLIAGIVTGFFAVPAPEARAIDPVTIAILAPFALKAAQVASPYIIRGLKNMGVAAVKMLPDMIGIFKLPVGMIGMMVGWPFGYFQKSALWTLQGCVAPFKLAYHAVMTPVGAFGFGL